MRSKITPSTSIDVFEVIKEPCSLKVIFGWSCFFLNTHLGYSLDVIVVYHYLNHQGYTFASRGIVGKNWSTRSKTTVRSKRVFPLEVRRGPHHRFPTVLTFYLFFILFLTLCSTIFTTSCFTDHHTFNWLCIMFR